MGSGFSGKYRGTFSSPEGGELRRRVLEALEHAGGSVAGDSAARLAEELVRIALGEPVDEADLPEPGDVAFDLALDALSALVPGGPATTRSLSLAAKYSDRAKRAKRAFAPRVPGEIWVEPDEYARAMREVTRKESKGQLKAGTTARVWTDEFVYEVSVVGQDEYYIVDRRGIE